MLAWFRAAAQPGGTVPLPFGTVAQSELSCVGIKLQRVSPLLGQGGVAAPLIKYREATAAGADGVVGSSHRIVGS